MISDVWNELENNVEWFLDDSDSAGSDFTFYTKSICPCDCTHPFFWFMTIVYKIKEKKEAHSIGRESQFRKYHSEKRSTTIIFK